MEVKPGYKQTEVGVIPEDWDVKTLADLGSFMKGQGIKRDDVIDDGIACIRYGELYTRYDNYVYSPESGIPRSAVDSSQRLMTGDLLFAGSGETAEEIGKCVAYLGEMEAYAGGDIVILRPVDQNSLYLGHLLNHTVVAQQKARYGQGDAVVHISARNLAMVKLPLPPTTDEQDSIATALSDVDALLDGLDRLIAKKRNLKLAAMQQLLTGKTRLPGFEGEWEVKRLGDGCDVITKGTTPTSIGRTFTNTGVNFVKIESLSVNGKIISDKVVKIDSATNKILKRSQLNEGDILISIAGALGRVTVVEISILPANTNQALAIVRISKNKQFITKYVYFYLNTEVIKKHFEGIAVQGAQANLSLQQIAEIPIYFPPTKAEQTAIAAVLSAMDAEIEALEIRRAKTHDLKQAMMQELLTGKTRLVPLLNEEDA